MTLLRGMSKEKRKALPPLVLAFCGFCLDAYPMGAISLISHLDKVVSDFE
jgi:formate hydrogenlyase subunit 6/NADH:ubiquinone oxidoreductase subunit I